MDFEIAFKIHLKKKEEKKKIESIKSNFHLKLEKGLKENHSDFEIFEKISENHFNQIFGNFCNPNEKSGILNYETLDKVLSKSYLTLKGSKASKQVKKIMFDFNVQSEQVYLKVFIQ